MQERSGQGGSGGMGVGWGGGQQDEQGQEVGWEPHGRWQAAARSASGLGRSSTHTPTAPSARTRSAPPNMAAIIHVGDMDAWKKVLKKGQDEGKPVRGTGMARRWTSLAAGGRGPGPAA